MPERSYRAIVSHYEDCLRAHGAGARAVDWKSAADAAIRYDVMLGIVRPGLEGRTLLDFGCGLGGLRQYMAGAGLGALRYTGLEISEAFADAARVASPGAEILCMDVLEPGSTLPAYDYVVMNGIFTRRETLSVSDMQSYLERLLPVVFASCRTGLAFNVMSKAVDFESDVLFHPDPGVTFTFLTSKLTRNVVMRNDYGLYEATWYLYREPLRTPPRNQP